MPSKLGNCVIISGETSVAPYADTMKIGVFLRNTWACNLCCGELILAALPLRKPPNGVFVEGGFAMSNKGIDVDSIVGDDFSDLSPEDMALLTGRGSNDVAPQSTPSAAVASLVDTFVSVAMSVASYFHVSGTCKKH